MPRKRKSLFRVVTQRLAGDSVDEMELGAGWAGHCFVGPRLVRRLLGKQRLHLHARPGASKHDQSAHGANIGARDLAYFDPDQIHDRRPVVPPRLWEPRTYRAKRAPGKFLG
jgi:hypothetical protein